MAFRSRARQFERKLSQTFLSKLRERERSSVEVVNPAPSNFMRVVTRWSYLGLFWSKVAERLHNLLYWLVEFG